MPSPPGLIKNIEDMLSIYTRESIKTKNYLKTHLYKIKRNAVVKIMLKKGKTKRPNHYKKNKSKNKEFTSITTSVN